MDNLFHHDLKFERLQRAWSQRELARRANLTRTLVSLIESGIRIATPSHRTQLIRALGLGRDTLGPSHPRGHKGGWPNWQQTRLWETFRRRPERYRVDRDRPNWQRFRAARKQYGRLYDELLKSAIARVGKLALADLLHFGCCESGLEALLWLRLLVAGAILSWVAAARLGWCRMPMVDLDNHVLNDRLWPAFVLSEPFLCALLPQVRLRPWDSKPYRLDFLACVRTASGLVWVNVEVDGAGHDTRWDRKRTAALRLPRVSLSEEDILADNFLERLQTRLLRAVA